MATPESVLDLEDILPLMRTLCLAQVRVASQSAATDERERAVRMLGELHRAIIRQRRGLR